MDKLTFPFDKTLSHLFGHVRRPIVRVEFWSRQMSAWIGVIMLVDTGADYSLLPRFYADKLGIDLSNDCERHKTGGIGGKEKVFLHRKARVRLGKWERTIPIGFLKRNNIPPLLGRQKFLETFKVTFFNHYTTFSEGMNV